jgi:hypothetical protein
MVGSGTGGTFKARGHSDLSDEGPADTDFGFCLFCLGFVGSFLFSVDFGNGDKIRSAGFVFLGCWMGWV